MREGIDDHRMLQLFDQFYRRLLVKNQTAASSFKAELDTLMQKYKSWAGSKSLATEDFSKDRISLLNLLTRMQNSIVAHSVQLSISENEMMVGSLRMAAKFIGQMATKSLAAQEETILEHGQVIAIMALHCAFIFR
jgi:hypothetical protein